MEQQSLLIWQANLVDNMIADIGESVQDLLCLCLAGPNPRIMNNSQGNPPLLLQHRCIDPSQVVLNLVQLLDGLVRQRMAKLSSIGLSKPDAASEGLQPTLQSTVDIKQPLPQLQH